MRKRFLVIFGLLIHFFSLSAQGTIKGTVTDASNGETVIACNIILQGTTIGTVSDFDGKYEIKNIPAGTYNVIYSFISYEKHIEKLIINNNETKDINVALKTTENVLNEVVVTSTRRSDSEISMLSATKKSLSIANGISSQQISRSLDKDASEVVRRIPGVSIRDGKFVVVRGLTERYNSVWLNGSSTPSSESDVRAFSFDVIPSGQIDNILIYKTPAPEIPADFAGAMINIKSKSLIDGNGLTTSVSTGYQEGTTGQDFFTYKGSNTDWLGYDNSSRVLPATVPATNEFKNLFDKTDATKIDRINDISKAFSTNMVPYLTQAKPDADVQIAINRRFALGDMSLGTISAIGYNATNTSETGFRAAYVAYPDTSYRYLQNSYSSKVRISLLSNWTLTFGDNQKIEFRNIFNNNGISKTVLKEGYDFYRSSNERSFELGYESRLTYSGQLGGSHKFNNDAINLDWLIGYSYANKNQPDVRRVKTVAFDAEPETQYMLLNSTQTVPDALGRMFFRNEENIKNAALNYNQKFQFGDFNPELKAGAYYELKNRQFDSRVFGYSLSPKSRFYTGMVESFNNTEAFNEEMFTSLTETFNTKIDYNTGLVITDATQAADSYTAENELYAGYLAFNLPITKWLNTYVGFRLEKNKLTMDGFLRDGTDNSPIHMQLDTLNIFPSINNTINISDKLVFRLAGGKTINRPEFREVSPFVFYNFEENATTYGNPNVVNAYVSNADGRFEFYPTPEEVISLGVFYKHFENPIESKILYTGSGWNYTFENAEKALSYGLELDVKKRLHEFEKSGNLKFLSHMTFVLNASLIRSSIVTDEAIEGTSSRSLQGQSPYILNLGAYYNDVDKKMMTSIMYNITGERIAVVGDKNIPHIYEMPFNSLDFSFEKGLNSWLSLKLGIKNLMNDDVVFLQNQAYMVDGEVFTRQQITNRFHPGRQFKLGVSMKF